MYVIISKEKALIVDPFVSLIALQLLKDSNIDDVIILPTHEHYDHISGINWLKNSLNCRVIAIKQCAQNLLNPMYNASAHFDALFLFSSEEVKIKIAEKNIQPYRCKADKIFTFLKVFTTFNYCFSWAW